MLWRVQNTDKYFLGSLHLLPPHNQKLDERIWCVHEKVSRVVFECDFSQWKVPPFGIYDDGGRLDDVMPPELYANCAKRWETLNVQATLNCCKPWWAAQLITINTIRASGFTAGVDGQLFEKTDPSQRAFLEHPETYYLVLNEMPLVEQVTQLQECCNEEKLLSRLNQIHGAWQASDLLGLSKILETAIAQTPLMVHASLGWRNRAWTPKIIELLSDSTPTLFVLGALHYIGADRIEDCLNDGHEYVLEKCW